MQIPSLRMYVLIVCLCLPGLPGCGTVKSAVPGLGGNESSDNRRHFPVTAEEAVVFLRQVAPQHGWEVVSTGDEFDIHGPRGKFFRLEAERTIGSKKRVSGVFYSEADGSYVTISDKAGLPEALVEPLVAAIKEQGGIASTEP